MSLTESPTDSSVALDNNLEVSFSRVKYDDIAPRVGLYHSRDGYDIPTFPMFRARLSDGVFMEICKDIELFTLQYRPLDEHDTEEARSRLISAVKTLLPFSKTLLEVLTANNCIYLVFQ